MFGSSISQAHGQLPRRISTVLIFAFACSSVYAGEGIFGTKVSPVAASADTGMGAMPIAQMFVALLVVLAMLKWLLPAFIKKYNKRSNVTSDGIQVRETATVGTNQLFVVEVRGRALLIGSNATSLSCLADVSGDSQPPLPTFQELIEQSLPSSGPKKIAAVDDVLSELDRLKTFGK